MRFSVETLAPEYGVAADEGLLIDAADTVDASIEVQLDDWQPVSPSIGSAPPERILFVDGVRRIDARVWFDDGGAVRGGVCASVAAGAVVCDGRSAIVGDPIVRRGFFATATDTAGPIATRHGAYEYFPCKGESPEDIYLAIHDQMTLAEAQVASAHGCDLVVYDGPLRGRTDPIGVGYVKTQQVQYLPDVGQAILGQLSAGQRTPIFLIGGRGFTRYSWYLRLPGPRSQPLSGIVRCEVAAVGTVARAIERADAVSVALPRFASEPHKEPRAPQNLYPIAGLENALRHRLGDQLLMERALRRAAAVSM